MVPEGFYYLSNSRCGGVDNMEGCIPKKALGLRQSEKDFWAHKVTNQNCMKWGVCGNSKNTALRLMEEAGLIRLDLKRGRSPIVQIIDDELRGPVT